VEVEIIMSNFNYTNLEEILSTNSTIRGTRFLTTSARRRLIVPVLSEYDEQLNPNSVEVHAFLPNTAYVENGSFYNLPFEIQTITRTIQNSSGQPEQTTERNIILDIHNHLHTKLKLFQGDYKLVYNFFVNYLGGPSEQEADGRVFISDISENRRELKLKLINNNSTNRASLESFVLSYLSSNVYLPPIVLNFGENMIVDVINVTSDGDNTYFFVKLYDELPQDIDLYYECWVGLQILKPLIESVKVLREDEVEVIPYIKGANFEANTDYWVSSETDYKSWTDLLSTNVQTSQEILNRYIGGTSASIELNVDFREFRNFIFYSSAEDRVQNFNYKVSLIEQFNGQLELLDTYTGSVNANKIKIKGLREKLISGFDNFEKFLYYETTSSNYYTTQSFASITPYPKYELDITASSYHILTKEGKFNLYPTISEEATNWYIDLLDKATDYDLKNYNSLEKSIPEYLRDSNDNEQFVSFVNMVGQHFDIMYLYTDHILRKSQRKENPKDGMSQDLIYHATKNLGWQLTHGTQAKDLWEYALGVSGSGEPIWTGRTTTNKYLAKSEEQRTKEVWRRVLNNLPYVYKTKGTGRAVKALLAAYGIPQTLLSIREYGGPDTADFGKPPTYEWEKHTYYLNLSGSWPSPTRQHHVEVPWDKVNNVKEVWQYPDTLTFRWKMEPDRLYDYEKDPVQTVLQKQSGSRLDWFVTVHHDGTDIEKGSLKFHMSDGTNYKSASINDTYLFDDIPLNIMIRRSSGSADNHSVNQKYELVLRTGKYGKIAIEQSASIVITGSIEPNYNRAWSSTGKLYIGSGSNPVTNQILSGSIYELRYWSNILSTSSFNNHTLSPRAYNGNYQTSSFYDLQAQWKFWDPWDVALTQSLNSTHPNRLKDRFYETPKTASFYGFNIDAFESITENYTMEVVSVANDTPFTEKIRIDSASLLSPLSMHQSNTVTQFDRYSIDSNKLMVAFSPQHIINEDIYEAIGYTILDDYFGEYSNVNKNEYPRLKWFSREYWQKYENKNDFTAYVRLLSAFDFSVFEQIRQTLPLRVNEILGVVVEPNVLERSKQSVLKDFSGINQDVIDTNDLSKLPKPVSKFSYNKGTVLIGFDEDLGSKLYDIEGEYTSEVEVVTQFDEIENDVDLNFNVNIKDVEPKKTTIIAQNKILNGLSNTIKTTLDLDNKSIIGKTNDIRFTLKPKAKFVLESVLNSDEENMNVSIFWSAPTIESSPTTIPNKSNYTLKDEVTSLSYNSEEKITATYEQVYSHVDDGYYKKFEPVFYSMPDYVNNTPTTHSLIGTNYVNPTSLPTGIQNHRYLGSKVSLVYGDEINETLIPSFIPPNDVITETYVKVRPNIL
jgi:hypothetical protein